MHPVAEELELPNKALAAALRAVRKHRRMDQASIASALGISRRSYIAIEAGVGRLPVEQLIAFADVTDSDRLALFAAVLLDRPSLAVHCADNKLMTIMMVAIDDFGVAVGDRMSALRPQELISAFEGLFDRLTAELTHRDAAESFIAQRLAKPRGNADE